MVLSQICIHIAVLIAYFLVVYIIAYFAIRKTHSVNDYLIGSRQFNGYITAMGAGASDMSGWLLMGLPGAIYVGGLSDIWLPLGLLIGAWCNWYYVAPRLRYITERCENAVTIPEYLSRRFSYSPAATLEITTAVVSIFFFAYYAASGLVAGALLFHYIAGIGYTAALWLTAIIMIVYTSAGGYIAINWLDAFQGTFILCALIFVPLATFYHIPHHSFQLSIQHLLTQSYYFSLWPDIGFISFISLLAWGLGYFGQPHILARFMSARDAKAIRSGRFIGISWVFLCLLAAITVGLIGHLFYMHHPLAKPENVFLDLSMSLFPTWFYGLMAAAVLSAIMNVISAQLLASSSALTEDILFRKNKHTFSDKKLILFNRLAVIAIMLLSLSMARHPDQTILSLVGFAWAGLGSSLGPVILLSLYWSRLTYRGALAGIVTGAVVVILWHYLPAHNGIFNLYAMIPGFLASLVAAIITSLCDKHSKEQANHLNMLLLDLKG